MATHLSHSMGSLSDQRQVTAPLESIVITDSAAAVSVETLPPTPPLSRAPQDLTFAALIRDAINQIPQREAQALVDLENQRKVLDRLRAWRKWDTNRRRSPIKYILSWIYSTRPSCPSHTELLALATYFFPLRVNLTATICDFICKSGVSRCETSSVPLFQAYKCRSSTATALYVYSETTKSGEKNRRG